MPGQRNERNPRRTRRRRRHFCDGCARLIRTHGIDSPRSPGTGIRTALYTADSSSDRVRSVLDDEANASPPARAATTVSCLFISRGLRERERGDQLTSAVHRLRANDIGLDDETIDERYQTDDAKFAIFASSSPRRQTTLRIARTSACSLLLIRRPVNSHVARRGSNVSDPESWAASASRPAASAASRRSFAVRIWRTRAAGTLAFVADCDAHV